MSKQKQQAKAHAKYSASGSERWLACPGSIALSERAPPQRESEYAVEGTQAHACLEILLNNHNAILDQNFTPDMIQYATQAIDWIECEVSRYPGAVVMTEQKVDASPFTCPGQFGTLDCAIVQEFGTLTVIDYKYGMGVAVDPEENSQLLYYALGVSHQFHHNFSHVRLVVIQPRAYREDGETTRVWECSMETLFEWGEKFKRGVEACEDPLAPLKASEHCRWCPAATICPELKDRAMERAAIVFSDDTGIESVPEPKLIQIRNLGIALDACEKLDAWITKVREHAMHVLERGEKIDGFKLVAKRSIRKWIDVVEAGNQAAAVYGDDAFTEPELLSPAQLEKKLGLYLVSVFTDRYTSSVSSGVTLARESDKRPAVDAIQDAFGEGDTPKQIESQPRKEEATMPKKTKTKKKVTKKKVAKRKK